MPGYCIQFSSFTAVNVLTCSAFRWCEVTVKSLEMCSETQFPMPGSKCVPVLNMSSTMRDRDQYPSTVDQGHWRPLDGMYFMAIITRPFKVTLGIVMGLLYADIFFKATASLTMPHALCRLISQLRYFPSPWTLIIPRDQRRHCLFCHPIAGFPTSFNVSQLIMMCSSATSRLHRRTIPYADWYIGTVHVGRAWL